jgi:hypothetical protein
MIGYMMPSSHEIPRDTMLVYALIDPRSGAIRYVGKSCSGPQRPSLHRSQSRDLSDKSHKARWLRQLNDAGFMYEVRVLERCQNRGALAEAEERWIWAGVRHGWPLTNSTFGADGPSYVSAETRAKLSAARLGKPRPEMRGRPRPDVALRNRQAQSRETIEKRLRSRAGISNVKLKGIPRSPEVRAKISASHIGIKASAETRAQMSKSQKDSWQRRKAASTAAALGSVTESNDA